MTCQVEQIGDCGDISTIARALFLQDKEENWLTQCVTSLSSCGNLLVLGFGNRLCILTSQWVPSLSSNTFIISWSGTLPSEVSAVLAVPICPSTSSSQNGPDWFCIIVGFKNGSISFYTSTGHLLLQEKLEIDKPVLKLSCHTGTYGTLPDDVFVLYQNCECVIAGASLFPVLRYAKAQLARVQAGAIKDYTVDSKNLNIKKWLFNDEVNDAAIVGLEIKNTYDHLLAASTYGGYDSWYRSIPPANTLVLSTGAKPFLGFHYALEGGTTPPLQDVARAVASKIMSALPTWLSRSETVEPTSEPRILTENLSMRTGLNDDQRRGISLVLSPDKRLAAVPDTCGRVMVIDLAKGHIVRLFKGHRDAQCAFVQVFEQNNKKPQLSTIKETRRALFLIIYNPRKGIIDIRLMQRGNRVAVFTATKNAKLIYNTCGLVGAEPSYTQKKLNLPELQCVLLDPDGKLKYFNIPFFFVLDGEHSDRSKDMHILREVREYMKKTQDDVDEEFVLKKCAEIKTVELKKHCVEMLIRNYNVPSDIVMRVVTNIVTDSKIDDDAIRKYFYNLVLATYFYRKLNNKTVEFEELVKRVHNDLGIEVSDETPSNDNEFDLLVDDDCILERLLIMAQEKHFKEHSNARVTFAENVTNNYKEFVTCYQLDEINQLTLKPELNSEKLGHLSSVIFKQLTSMKNINELTNLVLATNLNVQDIIRLLVIKIMDMSLDDLNLELIKKLIEVIYYLCLSCKEATSIIYNETSEWWQSIRELIIDMPCPLRSMIIAMVCKAVAQLFEKPIEEDAWESVSKENAKWGLLIGKLEDISILSIVMSLKEKFIGDHYPLIPLTGCEVSLKLIYSKGKGSVTELISKWLCSIGVPPEALIANELIDKEDDISEDDMSAIYLEDNKHYIENNARIFKWFSLLRQQFPFSTCPDYVIVNMSWEYALSWQKYNTDFEPLKAVISCIKLISDPHLKLGLTTLLWTTYLKPMFESSCRLVNKVGKLPKDGLCIQGVGLNDTDMLKFLQITNDYLKMYYKFCMEERVNKKSVIQFEKIWDDCAPSLVEIAQDTKLPNTELLCLTLQISCTIYFQCQFNLKVTKPLNSLYDIDYHYIFDAINKPMNKELNLRPSERLKVPRMKFINKLIRGAIDTISCQDGMVPVQYDIVEFKMWMEGITGLAKMWRVDDDFIDKQQVICLYHSGYDSLSEELVPLIRKPESILPQLLNITALRLKRNLETSDDPAEWLAAMPPHLVGFINGLESDSSVSSNSSLESTVALLSKVIHRVDASSADEQTFKMTELMIRGCETILELKL